MSGGASRETWAFALEGRPLIVQRERPGAMQQGRMVTEVALLRAARDAGVPVPEVVHVAEQMVVLERVVGESIPRKLLRDDDYATVRPALARECGRILAAVHRIPRDVAPNLDTTDQVESFRALLGTLGEARPALELGFRWLERNRPATIDAIVVHGDFRTGNLLISPAGVEAVLDWELAHVSDPLEDLGWFCARPWRFGSPHAAGGFGSRRELWAGYEEAGGRPVDPDAARWWEAVACLKWAIMCIVQSRAHLDGFSRSVELAAIGRRVCESESDLLALVAGEDWEA